MTAPLFMLHLPLDQRRLTCFGLAQKLIESSGASDPGYLVHAALRALFGGDAPKPFDLPEPGAPPRGPPGRLPLLAYSARPLEALREHARTFADPKAWALVDWDEAAEKPMPAAFPAGARYGFALRTCPVTRLLRDLPTREPSAAPIVRGSEVDVHQAALARAGDSGRPGADETYRNWLEAELARRGGARPIGIRVEARRSVRLFRRARADQAGQRGVTRLQRPDVSFTGTLEVTEPAAVTALLARGVGRHRAFGFGMLLLKRAQGAD